MANFEDLVNLLKEASEVKKEVVVGKINGDLLKGFIDNTNKAKKVKKRIEAEMELHLLELYDKYGLDDLENEKRELWAKVYKELNISISGEYALNRTTGDITKEVSVKAIEKDKHLN